MMGTTHAVFALLCYYIIAYFMKLPFDAPAVLTFLIVGGLLPDIDHPRMFLIQQNYLFKRRARRFIKHRGIVHSLLAALVATTIVWVIARLYNLEMLTVECFLLGFISHLAADSLNPTGIMWLQPFSKKKIRNGIRTGSATEKAFFTLVVVAICAVLYTAHPEAFNSLLKNLQF